MEVTREPGLDATVFPDQFNEFTAFGFVGVVQPAASIDDVIFLQNTQSRSIGWGMGKDKQLPSVVGRMVLDDLFEPGQLLGINGHFVGSVLGVTKDGGGQTDQECLVGNLSHELRCRFVVYAQKHFQIGGIGGKFINTLEVCENRIQQQA